MIVKSIPAAIGLVLTFTASAQPAQAETFATCIAGISQDYVAAKRQYQQDLRDLIVAQKPGLTALADLNMDLQTALAEERQVKLQHLIETDPSRIAIDRGLSGFANFDWTAQDTETLSAANDTFRAQIGRSDRLQQQSKGHDQWPALRTFAQGRMLKHPKFKSLTDRLIASSKSLADRLKTCPPAPDR